MQVPVSVIQSIGHIYFAVAQASSVIYRNVLQQAQKRHPEFQTLYENTLQKIVISFNSLDVLLHREALLNVIELVQMLQAATSKNKEKEERETKLSRRLSRLSIASVSTAMKKIEPKKGKSAAFGS